MSIQKEMEEVKLEINRLEQKMRELTVLNQTAKMRIKFDILSKLDVLPIDVMRNIQTFVDLSILRIEWFETRFTKLSLARDKVKGYSQTKLCNIVIKNPTKFGLLIAKETEKCYKFVKMPHTHHWDISQILFKKDKDCGDLCRIIKSEILDDFPNNDIILKALLLHHHINKKSPYNNMYRFCGKSYILYWDKDNGKHCYTSY